MTANTHIFEELRKKREIFGSFDSNLDFSLTAFVGVFNASTYLDNIKSELLNQSSQDFFIVIVDNASSDETWREVSGWLSLFPGRIIVSRNNVNLGGLGSLLMNMDLVETDWFANIHQDDVYKPNHIDAFVREIASCDKRTVAISTSMGSMNHDGKLIARNVRTQWLLRRLDQPYIFLANLHTQTVPWPSTAFKVDTFLGVSRHWTGYAFADTEITMMLTAHGDFRFLNEETMYYRENPLSESHLVTQHDREITTLVSLSRVFNSNEFLAILRLIELKDRATFLLNLNAGLENRLRDAHNLLVIKTMTHEIIANEWGYLNTAALKNLHIDYQDFASQQSLDLIESLISYSTIDGAYSADSLPESKKYLGSKKDDTKLSKRRKLSLPRRFYFYTGKFIPFKIARKLLVFVMRMKIRFSKKHRLKYFE